MGALLKLLGNPQPEEGSSGRGIASLLEYLHRYHRGEQKPRMLVATGDAGDEGVDAVVPALLSLVRRTLGMDVVFVSEFLDGRRVFRHVEVPPDRPVIAVGASDALELSWCKQVVDGRIPGYVRDAGVLQARGELGQAAFPIGTHLSVPVLRRDGTAIGTVCCFSFAPSPTATEDDLEMLRAIAEFVAASSNRAPR